MAIAMTAGMMAMERVMMEAGLSALLAVKQLTLDGNELGLDQDGPAVEGLMALAVHLGMMRKGTQSSSSELLSPEQQERIDRHFMAELKRLGSDFPYEEFCEVSPGLKVMES